MTPIFTPFPLPEIQPVRNIEKSVNWLKDMKLVSHHEHAKKIAFLGSEYLSYCYPEIQTHQRQDMNDLSSWICLLDDHVENGTSKENYHQLINFLNIIRYIAEEPGFQYNSKFNLFEDNRLIQTLTELKSRIYQWTDPSLMRELMNSISHFISGLIWELSARVDENLIPDLNLFCAMRINSSGMYINKSIMQCINNITLPQELKNQPLFEALTKSILFVGVLDNDIYSYHKERESDFKYSNVIDIFQLNNPTLSQEEAISKAIDLRNNCLQCYIELKEKCKPKGDLSIYLKRLENIISGNLVLGFSNERYKVANIEVNFNFSTHNSADSTPPFHIPSIAWWWEYVETANVNL